MKGKPNIEGLSIFAILTLLIPTSGCIVGPTIRTYSGYRLQKSEVAVIKGWGFLSLFGYAGIDIYNIDGSPVNATKVEVLPGRHELVIRNYGLSFVTFYGSRPDYARVAFDFEAGHEYKIKFINDYIVDVSTGAKSLKLPSFSP